MPQFSERVASPRICFRGSTMRPMYLSKRGLSTGWQARISQGRPVVSATLAITTPTHPKPGKGWVRPMRTEYKIKQRVQKLLNQARDREGTPEGDVFYARAFELMAQYGYEQRDIDGPEPSEVGQRAYEFTGSYTEMQANLLLTIAFALHCTGFSQRVYNSTRMKDAVIFGCARHLERVDMLYALLLPVMLADA